MHTATPFLMSCKPHDNIPLAHLLWIMYICGRKCSQNFARTWVTEKKEKKWFGRGSGHHPGNILEVGFVARTTGLKSQVLKVLMFSYSTLHQEEERSFRKLHRIKGSDKLGRQAVNLDQSRLCLRRKTTAEEFKCNRAQTTFAWWLLHTWVWLVGSHLPKQTAPSGENNLRLDSIKLNERWKTGTASYVS